MLSYLLFIPSFHILQAFECASVKIPPLGGSHTSSTVCGGTDSDRLTDQPETETSGGGKDEEC